MPWQVFLHAHRHRCGHVESDVHRRSILFFVVARIVPSVMRPLTLFLGLSLAANAALVGALALRPALAPPVVRDFFSGRSPAPASLPSAAAAAPVPSAEPKPTPKMWDLLYSPDPKQLVARLRAAGFSAGAIRGVVYAQVGRAFQARMRAFWEPDPNTPFWKLPGWGAQQRDTARVAEMLKLQRDQTRLLNEVLGEDFFPAEMLEGDSRQRYGDLPPATIRALRDIENDYNEMRQLQQRTSFDQIVMPEDREAARMLEKEKLADLAAILTPEQFEDYMLRNSRTAQHLRHELTLFAPTEQEYRALYRFNEAVIDTIVPDGLTWSPADQPAREAAQKELLEKTRTLLGEPRFAEYMRATDQEYRQLVQLTARDKLPPETAVQAYALRESVAQESTRILDDASLDAAQKRAALRTLADTTRTRMTSVLGNTAGADYAGAAHLWLSALERGTGVSFPNGRPKFTNVGSAGAPKAP